MSGGNRPERSVYAVARRHAIGTMLGAPLIVWGIPIALSNRGFSAGTMIWILLPFGLAWFLIGSVRALLLRCPNCRKSLFTRNGFSRVWPERRCSKCGADLVAVDRKGETI